MLGKIAGAFRVAMGEIPVAPVHENSDSNNYSKLLRDVMTIADEVDAQLSRAMACYIAEPHYTVVYKADRLTRSLMDFARIVKQFDR